MATSELALEAYSALLRGETRDAIAKRYGKSKRTIRRWFVLARTAGASGASPCASDTTRSKPCVQNRDIEGHFLPGCAPGTGRHSANRQTNASDVNIQEDLERRLAPFMK